MFGLEWHRVCESRGLPPILLRNMRNSWRTFGEWELYINYSQLETLKGHAGENVTARHYNRPDESMFIDAVADAYDRAGYFGEFKAK